MKKKCLILLAFVLFTACNDIFSEDARLIKIGAFNYYPGIFKDVDGGIKGFYVDALAEVSRLENIEFEYVFGSWEEGLSRIKTGEVDVLTSVAFTEDRAFYMDYSATPLLTVWGELYTKNTSELDAIREVQGKRVGVMHNDFNARNFMNLTRSFEIACEFVEYDSFDEIFLALSLDKIDAGVASVTYGAAKQKEFGLRSTGVIFNPFDIYFTTAKGQNKDILSMLDNYLLAWKHDQNSVFNLARQKWSHGTVGFIEVIPLWISYFKFGVPIILSIGIAFILLLKSQVKKATVKIKEGENKIRAIFEAANIGIAITNKHGKYEMFNAWWVERLGYSALELRELTNLDITLPEDVENSRKLFQDIVENKIDRYRLEKRFVTRSGNFFWGDLSVSVIRDSEDKVANVIGIISDITERKLAEEKSATLVKEKELLLREVYHRIKNNMGSIVGLIAMQMESEKNENTKASLQEIKGRIQSIAKLYERLNCSDNYRELPVCNYIEPLVQEIISGFLKGKKIETQISIIDYIMNIQILTPLGIIVNELITNSMKYAFAGRSEGLITVDLKNTEKHMILTVSDDGIGMPPEIEFTATTGFGLQIVKLLCDQIGGIISIQRGSGTQIILEFDID